MLARYKLLILLLPFTLILWPLILPGYFSHHDDLQVMRIFEMRKCLMDFQIPCRWVPDMGYGNGYPLFNYYSVFPYYVAASISFLLGYIGAAKVLFATPIILGGISIYFLAKELFGKEAAFVASILFSFAPYRALDIYVRGAIAESFAMAIIPLVFYFCIKLIRQKKLNYFIGLVVSLSAFLTSHNIMTILFIPVFFVFIIFFILQQKGKNILLVLVAVILGIGISSFFIFPAFLEKNLVQIDNLIRLDLNFRAHFVTIRQLFFDRFWGYGASSPGIDDTISFQIGWPHWWIALISILMSLINLVKRKNYLDKLAFLLSIIFILSIFMTHSRAAFIWEKIEILKFTQFPWRFLSITTFTTSLLGAYLVTLFKGRYKIIIPLIVVLIIMLNWSYFKPEKFYFDINDQQKLSGKLWEEQQKAAILDYLPQGAGEPKEAASNLPKITSGKAEITEFESKSNQWRVKVNVEDKATIEIPVFDFPNWQVFINNQKVNHSNKNLIGRIAIDIEKGGSYIVAGRFENTTIRTISNIVTAVSLLGLLGFVFYEKTRKNIR